MKAEEIKGFNVLNTLDSKQANMFKRFLDNFYNSWGEEARATIKPISIKVEKGYLRFDYKIYGRKEWLHVESESKWY